MTVVPVKLCAAVGTSLAFVSVLVFVPQVSRCVRIYASDICAPAVFHQRTGTASPSAGLPVCLLAGVFSYFGRAA